MSEGLVWIVEPVGYDEYGIMGVYESPEAAKAAFPDETWREHSHGWESADADACSNRGYDISSAEIQTLEHVMARRR